MLLGDSLEKALIDLEHGVHYVFVDTTTRELLIRYDIEKSGVNYTLLLEQELTNSNLLFVEETAVDTIVLKDSTILDDVKPKVIEEVMEMKAETVEVLDSVKSTE